MKNQKLFINLILGFLILGFTVSCNILGSKTDTVEVFVKMQIDPASLNSSTPPNSVSLDSLTEVKFIFNWLVVGTYLSVSDLDNDVPFIAEYQVQSLPLDGSPIILSSNSIKPIIFDGFASSISPGRALGVSEEIKVDDPDFNDDDIKYGLVVKGVYMGENFEYKVSDQIVGAFKLDMPLEISSESTNQSIVLNVDLESWFIDDEGNALDPRELNPNKRIESNIRKSIKLQLEN